MVMACHDKITCHEKFSKCFFPLILSKNFDTIHHNVHVCKLHLYKIHWRINPSNIEPKTLWKHTKVLTTKTLQEFINKEEQI
jgi:hypothetical protein